MIHMIIPRGMMRMRMRMVIDVVFIAGAFSELNFDLLISWQIPTHENFEAPWTGQGISHEGKASH